MCGDTGKHFNPFNVDKSSSPPNGQGSSDQYEVGDLSGKYGDLAMKTEVAGSFVDPSITLFGRLSIVGRAIVIHKSPVPHRWVCANIELDGVREVKTAIGNFHALLDNFMKILILEIRFKNFFLKNFLYDY